MREQPPHGPHEQEKPMEILSMGAAPQGRCTETSLKSSFKETAQYDRISL